MPDDLMKLTSQVVAAYVSNHTVRMDEIETLIATVRRGLSVGDEEKEAEVAFQRRRPLDPADTYDDEWITCLEDGKQVKLLKRYLKDHHGMTPEEYLKKWQLPADYPLVAASYSETRRKVAKQNNLGKKVSSEQGNSE